MKNKSKKIISLFIIIVAIIVSFKIVSSNKKTNAFQEFEIKENLNFVQPNLNYNLNLNLDNQNFTQKIKNEISKEIAQEIIENNDFKIENLKNKINIEEKIINSLQDFEKSINYLTIEDLKISNSNTKADKINYFKKIIEQEQSFQKDINFNINEMINDFLSKKDDTKINIFLKKINEFINFYKNLEVPSSYSFLHLEIINNYLEIKLAFESLVNIEKDPLKTYIWLSKLNDIIKKTKDLEQIFKQEIEKINKT